MLSGFFLFCAFEARATCGILIIPLALGALLLKKHNIRAVFLPTASFFIFVSLFWLFLYIISGDFLIQYRRFIVDATMPKYYGTGSVLGHAKKMVPIINVLLDPAGLFHSGFPLNGKDFQRYLMNFELGLFYYLVWPAFFYCAVKSWKEKWPRLPLAAFGLLYLFFEFGSTNLMEYKPIRKLNRFLTILTVPGAVLTAMLAVDLWNIRLKKKRRFLIRAVTIFVVIVYVGTTYISLNQFTKFESVQTYREVFEKIKSDHPGRKIYVNHGRWELRGTVFTRLQPVMPCKFFPLAGVSVDDIHQAIVILDLSFFTKYGERKLEWKKFDRALRNVPKELPEGWKLISKHRHPMKRGKMADVYVLWAP